ncbi:MAG TPA: hypothetical protein VGC42_14130 [Kofleriaceae bacterium]
MSRTRPIAAVPALLLIAVAGWEVCAARRDARAMPDDAAWHAAGDLVRAGYQPGDLIVFAPGWVDPIGRRELGALIPVADAARMDAARYARIWELSVRGARAPEVEGLTAATVETRSGIEIRRYAQPPAIVVGDVLDRYASATGGHPALTLAEVGFAPHRCLQLSPVPGVPLRIVFPAFPLGRQLVGYVGIADVFTRRDVRSPVALEVELGGAVIASATAGVDDGWVRFAAATPPGAGDVAFVLHAADANRKLCFAAEARQ